VILQETDDLSDPSMLLAAREAEKSPLRFKLGAIIRDGKRIVSKAFNINKTHTKYGCGRFNTLHAEANAIYKAVRQGYDLNGSILYVYRYNGLLAKPCPDCQKLIRQYGIAKVVYSKEYYGNQRTVSKTKKYQAFVG